MMKENKAERVNMMESATDSIKSKDPSAMTAESPFIAAAKIRERTVDKAKTTPNHTAHLPNFVFGFFIKFLVWH